MSPRQPRMEDHPHSRLTELTDQLASLAETLPAWRPGDRLIIMASCPETGPGDPNAGLGAFGFDDNLEMLAQLLIYAQVATEAMGGSLDIMTRADLAGGPN